MHRVNSPDPLRSLVRGSLIVLRRKCGKLNCRCADGPLHETAALSYSVRGATRMLTLRSSDVRGVKAALARYKKAVAALDREALAGIEAVRRQIKQEKARVRSERR